MCSAKQDYEIGKQKCSNLVGLNLLDIMTSFFNLIEALIEEEKRQDDVDDLADWEYGRLKKMMAAIIDLLIQRDPESLKQCLTECQGEASFDTIFSHSRVDRYSSQQKNLIRSLMVFALGALIVTLLVCSTLANPAAAGALQPLVIGTIHAIHAFGPLAPIVLGCGALALFGYAAKKSYSALHEKENPIVRTLRKNTARILDKTHPLPLKGEWLTEELKQ